MTTTLGVGGATQDEALAGLGDRTAGVEPISMDELDARRLRAQALMREVRPGEVQRVLHAAASGPTRSRTTHPDTLPGVRAWVLPKMPARA